MFLEFLTFYCLVNYGIKERGFFDISQVLLFTGIVSQLRIRLLLRSDGKKSNFCMVVVGKGTVRRNDK